MIFPPLLVAFLFSSAINAADDRAVGKTQQCPHNPSDTAKYCEGTKPQLSSTSTVKYVCDDPRLGPVDLPKCGPLSHATSPDLYNRFGGLCPGEFLKRWWDDSTGGWRAPPEHGFQAGLLGSEVSDQTLQVGQMLDRFKSQQGWSFAPQGTPMSQRSVPPNSLNPYDSSYPFNYGLYRVLRPFEVKAGLAAAWFEQPGQGTRYQAKDNVINLLRLGFLEKIDATTGTTADCESEAPAPTDGGSACLAHPSDAANYCVGTDPKPSASPIKYLCDDFRLGPVQLPIRGPLAHIAANEQYRRFGSLCPGEFLDKYWNTTTKWWNYPPADGFETDRQGYPQQHVHELEPGQMIDRFGGEGGNFVAPAFAPYPQRSLPPSNLDTQDCVYPFNYHVYRVLRSIWVASGVIAPWFEQPGRGVQYETSQSVKKLLDDGFLEKWVPVTKTVKGNCADANKDASLITEPSQSRPARRIRPEDEAYCKEATVNRRKFCEPPPSTSPVFVLPSVTLGSIQRCLDRLASVCGPP